MKGINMKRLLLCCFVWHIPSLFCSAEGKKYLLCVDQQAMAVKEPSTNTVIGHLNEVRVTLKNTQAGQSLEKKYTELNPSLPQWQASSSAHNQDNRNPNPATVALACADERWEGWYVNKEKMRRMFTKAQTRFLQVDPASEYVSRVKLAELRNNNPDGITFFHFNRTELPDEDEGTPCSIQ